MESKSKSAAGAVTASAVKKAPMKHKFAELRIKGAENGYILHHEHPRPDNKDGMYTPPQVDEHVFSGDNADQDLQTKVGEILGSGKAPGNKNDKTKSGKSDKADEKGEKADMPDESESED